MSHPLKIFPIAVPSAAIIKQVPKSFIAAVSNSTISFSPPFILSMRRVGGSGGGLAIFILYPLVPHLPFSAFFW